MTTARILIISARKSGNPSRTAGNEWKRGPHAPPDGDDSAHGDCAHGDSAHGVSAQDDPVTDGLAERADAYAAVPLLNCLLREVARPVSETGEHRVHHLPGGDRLLRVRGTRRPPSRRSV
ncbi:hypothetical protein SVIOM74S_08572 [Streptomyces violarus]